MPCATMRSFGLMGENSTPMRTWLGPGGSGSGMSTYSRPSTGLPKAVSWTARILLPPFNRNDFHGALGAETQVGCIDGTSAVPTGEEPGHHPQGFAAAGNSRADCPDWQVNNRCDF